MTRLLITTFSLFLCLLSPALADSWRADTTASEIIFVDVLNGHEHIKMSGKGVRFKLHENLPAPLCATPNCSQTAETSPLDSNTPMPSQPAHGNGDE